MHLIPFALLLSIVLTGSVSAQEVDGDEGDSASADVSETEAAEAEELAEEEELDDPLLDAPGYTSENDEDFRPSEDIQSDRSITFPTDI